MNRDEAKDLLGQELYDAMVAGLEYSNPGEERKKTHIENAILKRLLENKIRIAQLQLEIIKLKDFPND